MGLPEEAGRFASFATDFESEQYNQHHYASLLAADAQVAAFVIRTMVSELAPRFGTLGSLFEIGNASTLRTAALAEPLLTPAATVTLTDVATPQLQAVSTAIGRVRQGELGIWGEHQTAMAAVDSRWRDVVRGLCSREVSIAYHDIKEQPVPPTQVRVEGHTLCSHTSDPVEYRQSLANFTASMTPGDIAIRLFDVRSTKYAVANKQFPGHPIDKAVVRQEADWLGLTVLGVEEFAIGESASAANAATHSTLSALGGAVLRKPTTITVIV